MSMTVLWIIIIVIMAVIEALTLGLTTIWFAGGGIVAAIFAALGAPIIVQVILFLVVSIALLYFTRPIAVKAFNKTRTLTNSEGLVGKHAYVTEEIDNIKASGKVKIDGMEWTARTKTDGTVISVGTLISVIAIEGVKAIVEEVKEEK